MDKLQKRMSVLFIIFSLWDLCARFFYNVFNNTLERFLVIENFLFIVYAIIFYITYVWICNLARIIQIVMVYLTSVITLSFHPVNPFFGLSILLMSFLLIWAYGLFQKHKPIKLVISLVINFVTFYFIYTTEQKLLMTLQWLFFIYLFIFILWYIFKDFFDKEKDKDRKERDRLIGLLEETKNIAHDAISAYEKYFKNNKDIS